MRRTILLCCSLAIASIAAAFILPRTISNPAAQSPHGLQGRVAMPPELEESEESEESPAEREHLEWMQLHDPATGLIPRDIQRREQAFAARLAGRSDALAKRAEGDYRWELLGPSNIGGRTRALAFDAATPGVMLAGGVTGGMWRTTDEGQSWRRTTGAGQFPSVTCIAQDTRDGKENIWYYGTGEYRTNSGRFGNTPWPGNGIFKSTDNGLSWTHLPSTVGTTPQTLDSPFEYVNRIVADHATLNQDRVYAACYGAIMRSTDGGASWTPALGALGNATGFTSIAIAGDGTLYAGFGSGGEIEGIWRSEDGVAWHNITPTGWPDSVRRIVLAPAPTNPDALYILAETPGSGFRIDGSYGFDEYYSLWHYTYTAGDGTGVGGSWSDRTLNLPSFGGNWNYNGLNSYTMHVSVSPYDENDVFIGGTNLYESRDGFSQSGTARWIGGYDRPGEFTVFPLHPDQHVLMFVPGSHSRIIAGSDGGIFLCENREADRPDWTSLNNGYFTTQFYTVAIDPASTERTVLGGLQDNGTVYTTSPDSTAPMSSLFGGDGSFCAMRGGGRTLFVSSQGSYLFRIFLDENGATTDYTRIDPRGGGGYLFVNPFTLDPSADSVMFLCGGNTLWRNSSIDQVPHDTTFSPASAYWTKLTATTVPAAISAVAVSTAQPAHRVYYGTSNGRAFRIDDGLAASPTPVEITGEDFPSGGYINCVAVDPADGDRALAVFTNYNVQSLFATTDAGESWTAVGGNLEEHPDGTGNGPSCRWATMSHRGDGTVIFLGTTTGLYSTTKLDGASTIWRQEGAGTIGPVRVDMIAARSSDGYTVVGTWGKGMYAAMIPTLGADDPVTASSGALFESIAPNPIRASGTISFTTPETSARTTIALYDLMGNNVATLIDEKLLPGPHQATLDVEQVASGGLPSGVYYCRIACGVRSETRRIVVER